MFEKLKSLREERGKIVKQMGDILAGAAAAKRDMTDDESVQHGKLFDEQNKVKSRIEAIERQIEAERTLANGDAETREREGQLRREAPSDGTPARIEASPEYRSAFWKWAAGGMGALQPLESRALAASVGSQGGFWTAPESFVNDLIKFMDDNVLIRQLATKLTLPSASSLGVPTLDADPADADWTTEILTGSEDATMVVGKRKMVPNPLAKRIKVSNELLRVSPMPVEQIVRARLGYKFNITQEKAYLLGNGASQPLGVFVSSTDGISAGRDVSAGNTTTAMTYTGLVNAAYAIKDQYRAKARWMFHRDGVKQLASILDTTGRPIWLPSMVSGQPDTLLGVPLSSSEYVPNTFTTGLYVGIIGDFSNYWIVDAFDLQIQRLAELYAETNQTGFIGRAQLDGAPVLAEAFARVKLA